MIDRSGQQLGNYRVIRLLGRGGFAHVYLGEHLYLKTQVAIKILQAGVADEDSLKSFLKEARTVAHLAHPHIVRVTDFGVSDQTPFLVMDYASHGTLRMRYPKGVPLPFATILPIVRQIAAALQYAHDQQVIHRDIKPENMLVGRNDEVLLSDFGLALLAQSSHSQRTQDVIGTVAYMSPEQIQGKPRAASDQYALGIVIYEWLTGDRPFRGSFAELCTQHLFAPPLPLHEKQPTIAPDIEQVILRALAKDPKQRFDCISAFASALEQASHSSQPVALAPTPAQPPRVLTPGAPPERKKAFSDDVELDDDLLGKAEAVVREYDRASISLLMRRLKIGYSRAARLIDLLEERGVINHAEPGGKAREVLEQHGPVPRYSGGSKGRTLADEAADIMEEERLRAEFLKRRGERDG